MANNGEYWLIDVNSYYYLLTITVLMINNG